MRGTLFVLVLAAAIAVGLWYLLAPSDTRVVTQPETAGPLRDPTPATGDSQTVDSGTASAADGPQTADSGPTMPASDPQAADPGAALATDVAQTTDSGTTPQSGDPQAPDSGASLPADVAQTTDSGTTPQAGDPQAPDPGAALPADVAQTTDSGTTPQAGDPQAPDSDASLPTDVAQTTDSGTTPQAGDLQAADPGASLPTDVAQTTDSGTTPQAGDLQAADPGAALPTDVAQTTDSDAVATAGIAQTPETGTVPAANAAQTTDSSAAEATLQIAAVEKADQSITQELVLAPAPEGTIERTPIDAPSEGESDQTDIVSVIARELERIKTAIRERLDADTKLHVQIEYDDSPEDAAQVDVKRNETDQTAGTAAAPPAQVAQTTDTDTASPARPAQTADSAATRSTNTLQTTGSDAAPPAAAAQTTDTGAAPPASVAQTTDSDAESPASVAQTTDSDAESPANAAQTTDTDATEAAAKLYVETLTETTPQTIPVDKADHFVTQDHVLSLVPEDTIESVSVGALANDEALKADTPITVVREVEQIETAVPEQLIAEAGGDLDTQLRVLVKYDDSQGVVEQEDAEQNVAEQNVAEQNVAEQNVVEQNVVEQNVAEQDVAEQNVAEQNVAEQDVAEQDVAEQNAAEQDVAEQNAAEQDVAEQNAAEQDVAEQNAAEQDVAEQDVAEQITVREILERILAEPKKPISIIKTVRYFEVMTLRELLDSEEDADTFLNVVTRPYRIEAATLADLLQRQKSENPDTIFYLHTVQPTDEQGIWGIVHFGLIENFARGMAVKRGEKLETYTVRIPGDADERLHDQSSSFLGKLIDRKTEESFVYNFRNSRMGRNPDRIYPGQEIVIIHFEPEELISIYKHFATG